LIRRNDDGFCFPNAGWSEQQKASTRARWFGETEFAALNCGSDSWQGVGLAADFARQD
jgi:hypothetical protein